MSSAGAFDLGYRADGRQNNNLRASWPIRASRAEVTRPKVAVPNVVPTPPKMVWLLIGCTALLGQAVIWRPQLRRRLALPLARRSNPKPWIDRGDAENAEESVLNSATLRLCGVMRVPTFFIAGPGGLTIWGLGRGPVLAVAGSASLGPPHPTALLEDASANCADRGRCEICSRPSLYLRRTRRKPHRESGAPTLGDNSRVPERTSGGVRRMASMQASTQLKNSSSKPTALVPGVRDIVFGLWGRDQLSGHTGCGPYA